MELDEFVALVPSFTGLSDPEQVKHLAWFLHRHRGQSMFDQAAIRGCFSELSMREPNLSREFSRLATRGELLKSGGKYRLEHSIRERLDRKYAEHETTVTISKLLGDLPGKISDSNERTFLAEALKCYKVQAFRAATVMTWNLAYDHLLTWIVSDSQRLATFNSGIPARVGGRRAGIVIRKREDFEDLKESEVLDTVAGTNLMTKNLKQILEIGLTRRNLAAHPTGIDIDRPTADDMIHTLVTNVVLKLR